MAGLMERVRVIRGMPWLKRGLHVEIYNGKKGRVSGGNTSGNINITLDGDNWSQNYHPKWKIKYFDPVTGEKIAEYGE